MGAADLLAPMLGLGGSPSGAQEKRGSIVTEFIPKWLTDPIEAVRGAKVTLHVLPDRQSVYEHFAQSIAENIQGSMRERGRCCLILPVGPTAHYPRCAQIINDLGLNLSHTTIIHMDEYLGADGQWIDASHPLSFRGVMDTLFYHRIHPSSGKPRVIFPHPEHLDEISRAIDDCGGVDVAYGGIGIHGHVAFNEPLLAAGTRSASVAEFPPRVVQLNPETVVMNASRSLGGWIDAFPRAAVTIGVPQLAAARQLVLYADGGRWQRTALRMAVRGILDPSYPVTALTSRRSTEIVTDADTAAGILE